MLNGLGGVFVKGLPKELRTEVAPANPLLLAAAFNHWGDAGEAQEFIGAGKASAVRTEGGGQARGIRGRLVLPKYGF